MTLHNGLTLEDRELIACTCSGDETGCDHSDWCPKFEGDRFAADGFETDEEIRERQELDADADDFDRPGDRFDDTLAMFRAEY